MDFVLQNRLNKLTEDNENISNSNNLSPPLSPPPPSFLPPQPLPPPPPSPFHSSQRYVPPPQAPLPPPISFNLLPPPPFLPTDHFFWVSCNDKRKKEEKEKIIDEIDDNIYELPDLPKLELGDGLLNTLGAEAEDILDDQFINSKELEEKTIEQIKEEFNFEKIKDAFDNAAVPAQLEQ